MKVLNSACRPVFVSISAAKDPTSFKVSPGLTVLCVCVVRKLGTQMRNFVQFEFVPCRTDWKMNERMRYE